MLRADRTGGIVRRDGNIADEPPTWLPVLTAATRTALQTVLADRHLRSPITYAHVRLATGIARCGSSGEAMVHAGSGVRARHLCRARGPQRGSAMTDPTDRVHPQIADHLLDAIVRDRVLALLGERHGQVLGYRPRTADELARAMG